MNDSPADATVTISDIQAAAVEIEGAGLNSPSQFAHGLSRLSGAEITLKLENLQPTGSFKVRGALIKLLSLDDAAKTAGVIAVSAGNHAQGVAFHGQALGIPVTIVMPVNTPFNKINRTEALGASVVLAGDSLAEAEDQALALAATDGLTLVHPYDDTKIIAGQGTAGLELLDRHPALDVIVVPIGGGGLAAGIAVAAKALKPDIEVIGVEAAGYASMRGTLYGENPGSGGLTVADGIAVKSPGVLTQALVAQHVDDIVTVSEDAIEHAMQLYVTEQRLVVEGAGAAGLAAIIGEPERFRGRATGLIVSGGNLDARLLSSMLMRGLVRDGRLVRLRVELPDAPGSLAKLTDAIGGAGGNILEVYHQRWHTGVSAKLAEVEIVVETRNQAHVQEIVADLEHSGYTSQLLTDLLESPGDAR